jgi:hydrogenase maturation protease
MALAWLRPRLVSITGGRLSQLELIEVDQLQPEHALALCGRRRTLVVDASAAGAAPFVHHRVCPEPTPEVTSHSLRPAALAAVHLQLYGSSPCLELLAVRGEQFRLGTRLSAFAEANMAAALNWLCAELQTATR